VWSPIYRNLRCRECSTAEDQKAEYCCGALQSAQGKW
jgi:hypothetical protein